MVSEPDNASLMDGSDLPQSASKDYESVAATVARWLEEYKQASPDTQKTSNSSAESRFKIYIEEALVDLGRLLSFSDRGVHLIRVLIHLDERMTPAQITDAFEQITKAWDELPEPTKLEAINLFCDCLYELQRHGDSGAQHRFFNFLCEVVESNTSKPNLIVQSLRGLMVHASGLLDDDLAKLVVWLRSRKVQEILTEVANEDKALMRLYQELSAQFRTLEKFKEIKFRHADSLRLPPIVSIVSRKGGVGKTSIAIGLALHYAASKRVYLLDLDVTGPSLSYYFRFKNPTALTTLESALTSGIADTEIQTRLFAHPLIALPGDIPHGNLMVAQSSSLPSSRHELNSRVYCGSYKRVNAHLLQILQALQGKADLIIIDNAPSLSGLSLLTFSFAYSSGGLTLFLTSPDIHDVGALQIEMDLFRGVIASGAQANPFRWICNKVPEEIEPVYSDRKKLQYHLRKHPALEDVPGFIEERLIKRYGWPIPEPIIVNSIKAMSTVFAVTSETGTNIDFELLRKSLRDTKGFKEICTIVDALLTQRLTDYAR